MIVVVSVHAYNLGIVKYDYKIVCVVARILYLELKKLCTQKEDDDKKKMVTLKTECLRIAISFPGSPKACVSSSYRSYQPNTLPLFRYLWNSWCIKLPSGHILSEPDYLRVLLLCHEDYLW